MTVSENSIQALETFRPKKGGTHPKRATSRMQLIDTAETLYQTLMNEKLKPIERAAIARALCDVQKALRVDRGLPDPGQLRPDSLPKKRAGWQGVIDLLPNPSAAGFADDEPQPMITEPVRPTAKTSKKELDTPATDPLQQIATPVEQPARQGKESLSQSRP